MAHSRWLGSSSLLGLVTILGLSVAGCNEPNYRTEVTPTGQGSVDVKEVPLDHPPATAGTAAASPEAVPTDPDLATIEALWPKLSVADHKTVSDLVRRLSASQP
jgi:hypothetical protein